ncbi:Uma2 family endonuclease [Pedobacter kyonggii]|uniref:Uma2 family endonuclease n=1 Tax=Pedobacter kyonggii TaxID=1926871 RepID=UPI0021CE9C03|nr:Uma2 family endonuclease [Pedobacter kyonggii]
MKNIKPYPTEEEQPPIKTLNEVDFSATYSYADYMRFEFEERLEIIKGYIFKMGPAPSRIHQKISGRIYAPIYNALNGHKCEVYAAPFDVRLAKKTRDDKEVFTVVQPDIAVICDQTKLDVLVLRISLSKFYRLATIKKN